MTARKPAAAPETPPAKEPRRFRSVEEMALAHHPEFGYLVNATLPVRPPTAEEAAKSARRARDDVWPDLTNPGPPPARPPLEFEDAPAKDPAAKAREVILPDPPPAPFGELEPEREEALREFNEAHDALPDKPDPVIDVPDADAPVSKARARPAADETAEQTAVMGITEGDK